MYHIKEDKRSKKSSELIYNALIELLQTKNFDKITISNIQASSGVGRATFYRHFDSMIDVLIMKCDLEFRTLFTTYISDCRNSEKISFILYFFTYWSEHSEIIEILIRIKRLDIIHQSLFKNSHLITHAKLPQVNTQDPKYEYFMAMRSGIAVSLLVTWMTNEKNLTPLDIVELITDSISLITEVDIFL